MKKTLSVILALVFVFALASSAFALDESADPVALLAKSSKASAAAKSYDCKMDMKISMVVDGVNSDITASVNMRYNKSPLKIRMKMDMALPPADKVDMEMYIMQSGGKLQLYAYYDGEWAKTDVPLDLDVFDSLQGVSDTAALQALYKNLALGVTTYKGKEIYTVSGWMDLGASIAIAGSLGGAVPGMDELQSISDLGLQFPFSMGIDPDTCLPLYMMVDMGGFMKKLTGADDVTIGACTMTAYYFNYNKAGAVKLPAAAKRAKAA